MVVALLTDSCWSDLDWAQGQSPLGRHLDGLGSGFSAVAEDRVKRSQSEQANEESLDGNL